MLVFLLPNLWGLALLAVAASGACDRVTHAVKFAARHADRAAARKALKSCKEMATINSMGMTLRGDRRSEFHGDFDQGWVHG